MVPFTSLSPTSALTVRVKSPYASPTPIMPHLASFTCPLIKVSSKSSMRDTGQTAPHKAFHGLEKAFFTVPFYFNMKPPKRVHSRGSLKVLLSCFQVPELESSLHALEIYNFVSNPQSTDCHNIVTWSLSKPASAWPHTTQRPGKPLVCAIY